MLNLFGRRDRDPDDKPPVTRRQWLIRVIFYVVLFGGVIWWARA